MPKRPLPADSSEYIEGSRLNLALKTAKRHLRCAQALASAAEWGAAVSHLILAIEEAVKADVLRDKGFRGARSHYTDAQMQELLRFHDGRHLLAVSKSQPPPWWLDLVSGVAIAIWAVSIKATPVQTQALIAETAA